MCLAATRRVLGTLDQHAHSNRAAREVFLGRPAQLAREFSMGEGPPHVVSPEEKNMFDTARVDSNLEGSVAHVRMQAEVQVEPSWLFKTLADASIHPKIFHPMIETATTRFIDQVGSVRTFDLDYRARWSFWKLGGVTDTFVTMTTDEAAGTVAFKLRQSGMLSIYEGQWTIDPAPGSQAAIDAAAASPGTRPATKLSFETRMCPKMAPPYPISLCLKSQAAGQARTMLKGVLAEAKQSGVLGGDVWLGGVTIPA